MFEYKSYVRVQSVCSSTSRMFELSYHI